MHCVLKNVTFVLFASLRNTNRFSIFYWQNFFTIGNKAVIKYLTTT